jgi:Fibrobacter succinogenes major domain (Fib_succ_major).
MAENLNFKTNGSYCYNDSSKYCKKYGRLYSWSAANKACPEGWHLPTIDEFETLFDAVGEQSTAANNLKSASVWNNDGNGVDDYSFTALPAGIRYSKGNYKYVGDHANFWSSIEYSSDSASYVNLYYGYDNARLLDHDKGDGMSVRCVMGEPVAASSSSSAKLSSSSVDADGWNWDVPKEARLNPKIKYDTMIDPRDKQVYKVVKIDVPDTNYSQVWMAENLNYADSVKTPSLKGSNWCYNDDRKDCEVSGRYYTWAAAIDSVRFGERSEGAVGLRLWQDMRSRSWRPGGYALMVGICRHSVNGACCVRL